MPDSTRSHWPLRQGSKVTSITKVLHMQEMLHIAANISSKTRQFVQSWYYPAQTYSYR
jgi:hypothetical protein